MQTDYYHYVNKVYHLFSIYTYQIKSPLIYNKAHCQGTVFIGYHFQGGICTVTSAGVFLHLGVLSVR